MTRLRVAFVVALSLFATGTSAKDSDGDDSEGCDDIRTCAAGCDKGAKNDCFDVATMYLSDDEEAAADPNKARSFFEKACTLGEYDGCTEAGVLFEEGAGSVDFKRAAALFGRACDHDDPTACTYLGEILREGRGAPRDLPRAKKLLTEACDDVEAPACEALGEMNERGEGTPKDAAKAIELFKKGCESGSDEACDAMHRLVPDWKKAGAKKPQGARSTR